MEGLDEVLEWLMEGDASIKYQTMKYFFNKKYKDSEIEQMRMKITTSLQDEEGFFGNTKAVYKKWNGTHYTMMVLYRLKLDPGNKQAALSCKKILDIGHRKDGGINFAKSWGERSENCITGMALSILAYFKVKDDRLKGIVEYLLKEQMKDKGWNCLKHRGHTHSNFHTTISVLEGLREYEKNYSDDEANCSAIRKVTLEACEFLLQHKLYKSSSTGKIIDKKMTKMSFPPRWRYDIIRALDFFVEIDHPFDERMMDALLLLEKGRLKSGLWKLEYVYPGTVVFDMEKRGKPSRFNTLRAAKVLTKYMKKKRKRKIDEEDDNEDGKKRKIED